MSAISTDPTRYYRASIAIPIARKHIFDERMAQLGIKTVGDLVNMVSTTDGVVEALKPFSASYLKSVEVKKSSAPKRQMVLKELKSLPVDVLERMYAEFAAQGPKK